MRLGWLSILMLMLIWVFVSKTLWERVSGQKESKEEADCKGEESSDISVCVNHRVEGSLVMSRLR